jgi:hypothetical protein
MPVEARAPHLSISLPLDAHAPRAARYQVAQVDRPSPDLRDAVVLLTSELVTRAVERASSSSQELELRVWMPSDVVRVEVRAERALLDPPELHRAHNGEARDWDIPDLDGLVFAQVADRWSIVGGDDEDISMWFEIDRQPAPVHSAV